MCWAYKITCFIGHLVNFYLSFGVSGKVVEITDIQQQNQGYEFFSEKVNWNSAKKICEIHQRRLLVFTNADEIKQLESQPNLVRSGFGKIKYYVYLKYI